MIINIISKYIIKTFIKIFVFISLVIITLGTIYELFTNLSFYIKYHTSFFIIIIHLFCNIPYWFVQILPIVTLLSLLFSVGSLSKNNEITAMKALGVNIYKIILLLIMLGFIIGTCDFIIREFIITKSNKYAEFLKVKKIRKENIKLVQKFYDLIFSISRHERIVIDFLNINKKILHNIMIEKYNDKFELTDITIAQYGIWNNTRWILYNGVVRSFNNNNNTLLKEIYFKKYISNIIMTPFVMKIIAQDIPYDNMTTRELMKYINLLEFFGQSEMKLRCALIALYIRYAAIFSHLVVIIIGLPFVLQIKIKNNIFNFTIALLLSLTYCWIQTLTNSLGVNFILSPFWATWFANITFTIFGICLIAKLRKIK